MVAISTSDPARRQRAYERNLGHSRFWAGVGAALLGGLLLFIANTLWAVGSDPEVWSPLAQNLFSIGILILGQAMVLSFSLSWLFRQFYRSDDRALIEIERGKQDGQGVTP